MLAEMHLTKSCRDASLCNQIRTIDGSDTSAHMTVTRLKPATAAMVLAMKSTIKTTGPASNKNFQLSTWVPVSHFRDSNL